MERAFVRLVVFGIPIYYVIITAVAWIWGVDWSDSICVFPIQLCLWILVKTQGKYHCKWAHYLVIGLILTDLLTYTDLKFDYIPEEGVTLPIIATIWFASVGATLIAAFRHFSKFNSIKRERDARNKKTAICESMEEDCKADNNTV